MEIANMTKEEILGTTNKEGAYEFGRQKGYGYGFVQGAQAERRKHEQEKVNSEEHKKIMKHHHDATVGLWCTDKEDAIPNERKHLFFQIKEAQPSK